MVRVAAVLAAALLAFAACFTKPDPPGQGPIDGRLVDSLTGSGSGSGSGSNTVPGCPYDNFDNMTGSACGTWGVSFGSGGGITRTSSTLHVQPPFPTASGTGCLSLNAFDFSQGVSIDIQAILQGAMSYSTYIEVQNGAKLNEITRVEIDITTGTAMVRTSCVGVISPTAAVVPYDIAQHRFFQLKPSATVNAVDILARGSGGVFVPLQIAACTWSNSPTQVKVKIGAVAGADVPSMPAVFDSLSCP